MSPALSGSALRRLCHEARQALERDVAARAVILEAGGEPEDREIEARWPRAQALQELAESIRLHGRDQTIERQAYGWFNRLISLRAAEAAGLVPPHGGGFARAGLGGLSALRGARAELLADRTDEQALRLLVLLSAGSFCAKARLDDPLSALAAHLLPGDLSLPGSLVARFRGELPDLLWRNSPDLLGSLFQHYWEGLGRPALIESRRELALATQLFTPRWLAAALVQNSIGAAWRKMRPDSPGCRGMAYLLPDAGCSPGPDALVSPESISVLDPACGSGNLLLECYECLRTIYLELGYRRADIPRLILERNLYGLDIDGRAVGVASAALLMRAMQDDLGLAGDRPLQMHLHALPNGDDPRTAGCPAGLRLAGSLARIEPGPSGPHSDAALGLLARRYDFVIANPPYLSSRFMGPELSAFARGEYPDSRADLYAMFMERALELLRPGGTAALLTMHSWMFLPSFRRLRERLLAEASLLSLVHLGSRAFEQITGEVVQTALFVLSKRAPDPAWRPRFVSLVGKPAREKPRALAAPGEPYADMTQAELGRLPDSVLCYWLGPAARRSLASPAKLGEIATLRQGLATGDNRAFVRLWHEVPPERICFGAGSEAEAARSGAGWFPYNKGAESRPWMALPKHVLRFDAVAREALSRQGNRLPSRSLYFRPSITWTLLSSSGFAARLLPAGFLFDVNGMSMFCEDKDRLLLLALLCSSACRRLLEAMNPTLARQLGNVKALPVDPGRLEEVRARVEPLAGEAVSLAGMEEEEDESSWAFRRPALAGRAPGGLARELARVLSERSVRRARLDEIELELDGVFAGIYGLEGELPARAARRAPLSEEADLAHGLVSLAVGLACGRYDPASLDLPERLVPLLAELGPNPDGIICLSHPPAGVTEALGLLEGALSRLYPGEVDAGLERLAGLLGRRAGEDPRGAVRRYLRGRFHLDHARLFGGCPLYWKLTSGPLGACECLVYLHRMSPQTTLQVLCRLAEPLLARAREEEQLARRGSRAGSGNTRPLARARETREELERFCGALRSRALPATFPELDRGARENYRLLDGLVAPLEARAPARRSRQKLTALLLTK